MGNGNYYSTNHTEPESKVPKLKATIILLSVFILIILASYLSFYFGVRISPNDTVSPEHTDTLGISQDDPITSTPHPPTEIPQIKSKDSPTPTPSPRIKTKIALSVLKLSGFRSSNGKGSSQMDIRVGRNEILVTRGFISFDLSKLPQDANVTKATIRLYQKETEGNPFLELGKIMTDHLTYGDALDETDYALPSLTSNLTNLSKDKKITWKEADVTSSVINDIANARSLSQFRIHFEKEVKKDIGETPSRQTYKGDFVYFDSGTNYSENTGHPPQLVIEYF